MSQGPFISQKGFMKLLQWSYLKENSILCLRCSETYYNWSFGSHLLEKHTWKDFKIWWDEALQKYPNMTICISCGQGFSSMHAMKIHMNRCLLKNVYYKEMSKNIKGMNRKIVSYRTRMNKEYKDPTFYAEIIKLRDSIVDNYKQMDLDKIKRRLESLDRSKVQINPSER